MYTLYVNGRVPLMFEIGKEYNIGTGYLALTRNERDSVLLCRMIPKQERPGGIQNADQWKCSHYVEDLRKGKRSVAILCEVDDMEQADRTIDQYKAALKKYLASKREGKGNRGYGV